MTTEVARKLPLNVYVNKKYVAKNIVVSVLAIVFLPILIKWRRGYSLTNAEYLHSIEGLWTIVVVTLFTTLALMRPLMLIFRRKPVLTVAEQGLYIPQKPYKEAGIINWEDIHAIEEIAYSISRRDILTCKEMIGGRVLNWHGARKWCFAVKDITHLTNTIPDINIRKRILKVFRHNENNWLFCINVKELDCDLTTTKDLIASLIARQETKIPSS